MEKEELVFEFWNTFKGSRAPTKIDLKTKAPVCWHSHNKLTYDMRVAIKENLKDYALEDLCIAIDNYAKVLLGDEYFWTYTWSLSTFFTVKYEKRKDGAKKWWQFLLENFVEYNYLKWRNEEVESREKDPELTRMVISWWGQYTNQVKVKEKWEPSSKVKNLLIQVANNLYISYKGSPVQDKWTWIKTFELFLEFQYVKNSFSPGLNFLVKPQVWESDFPMWKRKEGAE